MMMKMIFVFNRFQNGLYVAINIDRMVLMNVDRYVYSQMADIWQY